MMMEKCLAVGNDFHSLFLVPKERIKKQSRNLHWWTIIWTSGIFFTLLYKTKFSKWFPVSECPTYPVICRAPNKWFRERFVIRSCRPPQLHLPLLITMAVIYRQWPRATCFLSCVNEPSSKWNATPLPPFSSNWLFHENNRKFFGHIGKSQAGQSDSSSDLCLHRMQRATSNGQVKLNLWD